VIEQKRKGSKSIDFRGRVDILRKDLKHFLKHG
jgi:hypothetical protein